MRSRQLHRMATSWTAGGDSPSSGRDHLLCESADFRERGPAARGSASRRYGAPGGTVHHCGCARRKRCQYAMHYAELDGDTGSVVIATQPARAEYEEQGAVTDTCSMVRAGVSTTRGKLDNRSLTQSDSRTFVAL